MSVTNPTNFLPTRSEFPYQEGFVSFLTSVMNAQVEKTYLSKVIFPITMELLSFIASGVKISLTSALYADNMLLYLCFRTNQPCLMAAKRSGTFCPRYPWIHFSGCHDTRGSRLLAASEMVFDRVKPDNSSVHSGLIREERKQVGNVP